MPIAPRASSLTTRTSWELHTNDQLFTAAEYLPLVIAARNGAVVRLSDVGRVVDSVQDIRVTGLTNGRPAVSMHGDHRARRKRHRDGRPRPRGIAAAASAAAGGGRHARVGRQDHDHPRLGLAKSSGRSLIAIGLVVVVVFVFLRRGAATFIPGIAVPLSLLGTFGVMWFLGYSLDNLSLMALTISTGFVVDDAIVVIENITAHGWNTARRRCRRPSRARARSASPSWR